MTSNMQRFHPLSIVIYTVKNVRNLFFIFILIFLNADSSLLMTLLEIALLLLLCLISGMVRYFFESYAITDTRILLKRGVFKKQTTEVPYERIQSIREQAWFFYKPFGITQLRIDTGSGAAGAEIALTAVPSQLIDTINHYRTQEEANEESNDPEDDNSLPLEPKAKPLPLYHMSVQDIILFTLTSNSIFIGFLGAVGLVTQFVPDNFYDSAFDLITSGGFLFIIVSVALSLGFIILIVFIRNILTYYNFQVFAEETQLRIEYGLLNHRVQTIPYHKIRGVRSHQNPLRRLLGTSGVDLLMVGSKGDSKEDGNTMTRLFILPYVSAQAIPDLLEEILPQSFHIGEQSFHYTSKKQIWYFVRFPLLFLGLSLIPVIWLSKWALIATVFCVLWLINGLVASQEQAYAVDNREQITWQSFSFFSLNRILTAKHHVQSLKETTTPFLWKKSLGHLAIFIKCDQPVDINWRFISQEDITFLKGYLGFDQDRPLDHDDIRFGQVGDSVYDDALAIRQEVFIEEQEIPPRIEHDPAGDYEGLHVVLYHNGDPIVTTRINPIADHGYHIYRFATLKEYRGQGYGGQLLRGIDAYALKQQRYELHLNAQATAIPFYQACGYTIQGPVFYEAGLAHQAMAKHLHSPDQN